MTTIRPVWVHVSGNREDVRCTHRVSDHGSLIRFMRCDRDATESHHGFPVCGQHFRLVAGEK